MEPDMGFLTTGMGSLIPSMNVHILCPLGFCSWDGLAFRPLSCFLFSSKSVIQCITASESMWVSNLCLRASVVTLLP